MVGTAFTAFTAGFTAMDALHSEAASMSTARVVDASVSAQRESFEHEDREGGVYERSELCVGFPGTK